MRGIMKLNVSSAVISLLMTGYATAVTTVVQTQTIPIAMIHIIAPTAESVSTVKMSYVICAVMSASNVVYQMVITAANVNSAKLM